MAGEDGVARTRAEQGRTRPLMTVFGQVSVSRIAYRSPGRPNVHPADAALNLPQEKHSHGLRKLAAVEAVRGSMEDAQAAVTRATGVKIGNGSWRAWPAAPPRTRRRFMPGGWPSRRPTAAHWC